MFDWLSQRLLQLSDACCNSHVVPNLNPIMQTCLNGHHLYHVSSTNDLLSATLTVKIPKDSYNSAAAPLEQLIAPFL